ncbi:MAG: histidine phosphatase family protein [Chloroflexota bacterium]
MTTVWFIRHAQSISNANMVTTHPATSEITELGHQQAEFIVPTFTKRPDLIVVSPYVRTWQTAVPTIEYFKPIQVEEWPVHEFTYLHPERYNGTRGSDRADFARAYWHRNDPFEKEMDDGESFAEMIERIEDMMARLREQEQDFIAVFSHGLFIRALIWMQLMHPVTPTKGLMLRYRHFILGFQLPNASIVKTIVPPEGPIQLQGIYFDHLPEELQLKRKG